MEAVVPSRRAGLGWSNGIRGKIGEIDEYDLTKGVVLDELLGGNRWGNLRRLGLAISAIGHVGSVASWN
jgi:hypothetical protein